MVYVIPLIIVVVIGVFIISIYNGLVTKRNRVANSWSQIEVQLKRRFDLIPNLVETVKGAAGHELGVLETLTKARSQYMSASTPEGKMAGNAQASAALGRIFMVAESNPALKANDSFVSLQNELIKTEEKIGFARQFYNDTVMLYNNAIAMFPAALFAGMLGFTSSKYFEAEAYERENVKVQF